MKLKPSSFLAPHLGYRTLGVRKHCTNWCLRAEQNTAASAGTRVQGRVGHRARHSQYLLEQQDGFVDGSCFFFFQKASSNVSFKEKFEREQ